jgi:hypothetical protein
VNEMMKKIVSTSLAAMLFTSSAFAAGTEFYNVDVRPGPYYVKGVTADTDGGSGNPACYAEVNWRDGSRFQLIRDLADGELYIFMRNVTWNISDPPGAYRMRMNFHNRSGGISGLNFQFNLVNKNTIVIRNIIKEDFLPLFTNNSKAIFVMPGSIQNAEVDLTGSTRALTEISKCIDASANVELYPNGRSNGTGTPRSFNNI